MAATFPVGARVECRYAGALKWFRGTIAAAHPNGTYDLSYEDGDQEAGVEAELVRPLPTLGARVEARFQGGTTYYGGAVAQTNADGTYSIQYDDGDREDNVAPDMFRLVGAAAAPAPAAAAGGGAAAAV